MKPTRKYYNTWPHTRNGRPIFDSTNEALLYAQFIWNEKDKQESLKIHRQDMYIKLKHERECKTPNYDRMFIYAVQAQLLRECLEECKRINDEPYQVPPGRFYDRPGERYDNTNHS